MTYYPLLALGGAPEAKKINSAPGKLRMVRISDLVIDDTYQRAVSLGSVRNIHKIIKGFDWNKFIPVIGVENDNGTVSVIDGQHRATAALTIGVDEVPCYILSCSAQEAAAAFAAINGNVTPVTPIDIWFASLAAGDQKAIEIDTALQAANVKIVRKKEGFAVGETRSISVLRRAHDFYGHELLITVLQCITETGNGNPGMLIGAVINGVGRSIRTKQELLAEPSKLFDFFDAIDFSEELRFAQIEYARNGTGNAPQFIITRRLNEKMRVAGL